jgi:hydroxymethylbilane synthase
MVVANAERAVARVLEATCQVPLAVHAVLDGGMVRLKSMISTPDGKQSIQAAGEASTAQAVELGERVAADLLKNGAEKIIAVL